MTRAVAANKPPAARRLRVLLLEGHAETSHRMVRHLACAGHLVRTCASLADAMAAIVAEPFDVMISDIGLPDTEGYDLMRLIRKVSGLPSIALGGCGMAADQAETLKAGFSVHLEKPVDLFALTVTLQRVAARPFPFQK